MTGEAQSAASAATADAAERQVQRKSRAPACRPGDPPPDGRRATRAATRCRRGSPQTTPWPARRCGSARRAADRSAATESRRAPRSPSRVTDRRQARAPSAGRPARRSPRRAAPRSACAAETRRRGGLSPAPSIDAQGDGRDRCRQRILGRRDRGAGRRPRQHVLGGRRRRAGCPCVSPSVPRIGWTCTSRRPSAVRVTKQLLRPDHAIGWNVGRAPAPGARLASHRVVDRDRDVVGVRTGVPRALATRSKSARAASGPGGQIARGRVARDAARRPRPAPPSSRRTRAGRAPRPARRRRHRSGPTTTVRRRVRPAGQSRRHEASAEQPAPAHALPSGAVRPARGKGRATRQAGYRKGKL